MDSAGRATPTAASEAVPRPTSKGQGSHHPGRAAQQPVRARYPALPGPEIPFLSASKQHGAQWGALPEPSDVKCSDPGTVELKGQASHYSARTLQGHAHAER